MLGVQSRAEAENRSSTPPDPALTSCAAQAGGRSRSRTCVAAFRLQPLVEPCTRAQVQAGVTEEACTQAPPRNTFQKGRQCSRPRGTAVRAPIRPHVPTGQRGPRSTSLKQWTHLSGLLLLVGAHLR